MRVATSILLDRACCSGDNDLHAKSSATCMFLTVSELKSLASAAMNVPKKELLTLPEAPSCVCPVPDQRAAQSWAPYGPYCMRFPLKPKTHKAVNPVCIMRNLTQPTIRSS